MCVSACMWTRTCVLTATTNTHVHIQALTQTQTHAHTHTRTHLFDHDAGEVPMLERSVDGVPGGQVGRQLQIQFVEFVHLFQSQLHLGGPVSRNIPARPHILHPL